MVLLCSFGHSPCLTAWRQSLISRWDGKFGASMVLLGPFFPTETILPVSQCTWWSKRAITQYTMVSWGNNCVTSCLWPEVSIRQHFPHSSPLHPPAPYLSSPSVSFPAWRDQQQTPPLDPKEGDHTKIPSSACEGQGEPAQAQQ